MTTNRNNRDLYNVSTYTDTELYEILELANPTDRELEAKILIMVNKYARMGGGNPAADQLQQFFIDIYTRFFDVSDDEDETTEGFEMRTQYAVDNPNISPLPQSPNQPPPPPERNPANTQNLYMVDPRTAGYSQTPIMTNTFDVGTVTNVGNGRTFSNFVGNTNIADAVGNVIAGYQTPQITQTYDVSQIQNRGVLDTTQNQRDQGGISLTKPVDYSKDTLNPLLKQTIKRVISIDSQYRENKQAISTEFTFNLSEPLRDVVSLKLYSIQIPFTWYTINSSFGGNFFYIKGDVAGINNGDHDYRVEINSGNYTASDLVVAINASIQNLITTYPDVSFGNTGITYNANSVKSTLTLNLKEAFGESNYYLDFVNWSSPQSNDDPVLVAQRITTLAGYLGYNTPTYDIHAAYSKRVLPQTDASPAPTYTIDQNNNVIRVVLYTPATLDYTSSSKTVVDTITLTLTPGTYTRATLLSAVNTLLLSNTAAFDTRYTSMTRVNVSNANQSGYGYAYVRVNIKLTRQKAQNLEGLKVALVLPDDGVWVDKGTGNSCFFFENYVNELSNVVSETPPLKSKYKIGPASNTTYNRIRFQCLTDEYDGGQHDYEITVPDSTGVGYRLTEYISAINAGIATANSANTVPNTNQLLGTQMSITNNFFAKLLVNIQRVFTTPHYTVKFYGNNSNADLTSLFQVQEGTAYDLSGQSVFSVQSVGVITFQRGLDRIEIIPKPSIFGSPQPDPFVIYMLDPNGEDSSITPDGPEALATQINGRIQNYIDKQGKKPLLASNVFSDPFNLVFIISKSLTYTDYEVAFESNQDTEIPSAEQPSNSWVDYLGFATSYDLTATGQPNYVEGTLKKTANIIQLVDGSNNFFYLRTFRNINGLNDSAVEGVYDVKITLTPGTYTTDTLCAEINRQFARNTLTAGSVIRITDAGTTEFRMNINKVFRPKDYRIVFYDQFSFVSCYSGASRNGNKSIQNATWDTTVGWIIGFRQNIIYNLNEYTGNTSDANIYFTDDSTCVMIGDTTVSTSLYNYFLIVLDDYTQNHLNDGLVTITTQETNIAPEDYTYVCDPYATSGSTLIAVPTAKAHDGTYKSMTKSQLYSFNQKVLSKKVKEKSYSKGPFVKDIFGIIPIKTSGLSSGSTYVEFGGTLQNQERLYFGPVNIHRMTIRLLNDRGDLVDLNNSNWSFSLVCEQLYRSNP